MNYTILITGGAGFIGKNLVEYLYNTKNNFEIIIIDNFITSSYDEFKLFLHKLDTTNKNVKITLFDFDIVDDKMVPFLKERYNLINEIYHLASLASPPLYKKNPLKTLDVGYIGSKNILELALHYNSKVLFSSTSEVYGDAQKTPQDEEYYGNVNPFGDRSCYDESKRVAEALFYTYKHHYNVDIRVARIFNTFGKYMSLNDGRIITEIIKHLINQSELTIYGDGNQTRSICYADDTVNMLIRLMDNDCNVPINIGNDIEMSINDIVDMTTKIYKKFFYKNTEIKIVYKELTQNDPKIRKPCLKMNKKVLGDTKYTLLEEALKETIRYFIEING